MRLKEDFDSSDATEVKPGISSPSKYRGWLEGVVPHELEPAGDKVLYTFIAAAAVLVVCVAVGCYIYIGRSSSCNFPQDDDLLKLAQAEQSAEKERAEKEAREKAERDELAKIKREEEGRKKLAEKTKAEEDAAKIAKEKAEEEAKKRLDAAKEEEETAKKHTSEAEAKAREDNLEVSLDQLKITKIIPAKNVGGLREFDVFGQKKSDELLAEHLSSITNENSIAIYYTENGEIKRIGCYYAAKDIRAIGNSAARTRYSAVGWPEKAKDSPWVVFRVVNPEYGMNGEEMSLDVFWLWNEMPRRTIFEERDTVDLKKECFVCNEAYNLYSKFRDVVYQVRWSDTDGDLGISTISSELLIEKFKPDRYALEVRSGEFKRVLSDIEKQREEIVQKIERAEVARYNIETWERELEYMIAERDRASDSGRRKILSARFAERKNEINRKASTELEWLGITGVRLTGAAVEKQKFLAEIDKIIKTLTAYKYEIMQKLRKAEEASRRGFHDVGDDWKDEVRKRNYDVIVVESVGIHGDGEVYNIKTGKTLK